MSSSSEPTNAAGTSPEKPLARRSRRRRHAEPALQDEARVDDRPEPERYPLTIDPERLDHDAAKVVRRLTRHGLEAYLVGGCVRDLLVGKVPKDFDVATNARPDDVRRLFRNSRIIGRRFRLVHVIFGGGKVIETATFRRPPNESSDDTDDLLIRSDNAFGEAFEDAVRRDFTINGLFYDLECGEVLDWVGGMRDIERKAVHTIGTPVVRFREDPVRILRAIKFAARLDFGITPETYDAIVQCRGALAMAARPRLFEELMRLMRSGSSHRCLWLAWETGVLDVLLPELAAYLADADGPHGNVWRILSELDRQVASRSEPFDDTILCTVLLLEPLREACHGSKDRVRAASDFLEPLVDRLNVPRRITDSVRRIVAILPRLEAGRPGRFARTPLYTSAHQVLQLTQGTTTAAGARIEELPPPTSEVGRRQRPRRRGRRSREGS